MKNTSIKVVLPAKQRENDLEFAIRKFSKKVERAKIIETHLRKARYEKPSTVRLRKKQQKAKKIAKERREQEKFYKDNHDRFIVF